MSTVVYTTSGAREGLAAVAVKMLPALEEEAKKRQVAHLKKGDELPVTPIMEERESTGEASAVAAKLVGVSKSYVNDAKRVGSWNGGAHPRPDRTGKLRSSVPNTTANFSGVGARGAFSHRAFDAPDANVTNASQANSSARQRLANLQPAHGLGSSSSVACMASRALTAPLRQSAPGLSSRTAPSAETSRRS